MCPDCEKKQHIKHLEMLVKSLKSRDDYFDIKPFIIEHEELIKKLKKQD